MASPKRTPFSAIVETVISNSAASSFQPFQHYKPVPGNDAIILFTNLIKSYFQNGQPSEAHIVFEEMPRRDLVSWTALISGYASQNFHRLALKTFIRMFNEGIHPNEYTISCVLKACKGAGDILWGRLVHGLTLKFGLQGFIYVDNVLLDMYASCCSTMKNAFAVFNGIENKNAVSWTTLIAGYTHRGRPRRALGFFRQLMLEEELDGANPFTFSIAVRACASIGLREYGEQMHSYVIKHGFLSNLPVMNSILDMYCRCGCLAEADQCFHEMDTKDLISWNTIISGYERVEPTASLFIFSEMERHGFTPNCFTLTSAVAACADLAALNCGQQIHGEIVNRGLENNIALANALIDMYAKCGNITDSCKVFRELPSRDLLSWTSMIIGYGAHGYGKEAIDLFDEMVKSGVEPDQVVFTGVLSACSHSGLVDRGLDCFNHMITHYRIKPNQETYGCAVDLLGRAGRIEDAYQLMRSMPFEPDESVWGVLLGAWKAHGLPSMDRILWDLSDLRPNLIGTYVMLSHIYASDGKWTEFARMRKLIKARGRRKETGKSWIEVGKLVCSFAVGDKMSCHHEQVLFMLDLLTFHMQATELQDGGEALTSFA